MVSFVVSSFFIRQSSLFELLGDQKIRQFRLLVSVFLDFQRRYSVRERPIFLGELNLKLSCLYTIFPFLVAELSRKPEVLKKVNVTQVWSSLEFFVRTSAMEWMTYRLFRGRCGTAFGLLTPRSF